MWQPMETAPKDGTFILIYDGYEDKYGFNQYMICFWHDSCEGLGNRHIHSMDWCEKSSYDDEQGGWNTPTNPLGWMPLPDPPIRQGTIL